jgi:hypothetical protein
MMTLKGRRRAAAVMAAVAGMTLVAGCGGGGKRQASGPTTTVTATTTTTTAPAHAKHGPTCPLTGTVPGDKAALHRSAVAVKIENLPAARPQYGLNQADIVYEEPVEGGITRFVAVFDCQSAKRIEPVRSARFIDLAILAPYGKLLFAYSGAIQPVIDAVDASGSELEDVGANRAGPAYTRDPSRYIPHNLETSTSLLYAAAKSAGLTIDQRPPAQFHYGRMPKGAKPAAAVDISYPELTSWTWDAKSGRWLRSYPDTTGPAMQGDGSQISAANVVVIEAPEYATAYVEDSTGAHENNMTLTGSGPAWVFRNGAVYRGTWERPSLTAPASFIGPHGVALKLTPGNTWEELVPTGDKVSISG